MDFYGYMGSPDAFSPDAERDFSFAGRAEHDGAESVEGPVLKAAEGDMGSRVAVVGRDDFCGTGDAEGQVVVCRRDEVSVLVEDADIGEDEPFLRGACLDEEALGSFGKAGAGFEAEFRPAGRAGGPDRLDKVVPS